jgi:RimJ/RimL family protein N-acetyltransferase
MAYRCLKQTRYDYEGYTLTALREADIYHIKTWRNEQMDALRQSAPLDDDTQYRYYHEVVSPAFAEEKPSQILLSYLLNGECIGYGGLVHINWDLQRAEFSYLVETGRHEDKALYQRELGIFFTVLKQIAFGELGLSRIFTESYDFRPYVTEAIERHGLRLEGRLRHHTRIQGQPVDVLFHGCLKNDEPTAAP